MPHPVDASATLRSIAALYEVDVESVRAYNGLQADALDEPVARSAILLPREIVQPAEALRVDLLAVREVAPSVPRAPASELTTQYTVAHGDTLSEISERFGVAVDRLAAANNLSDVHVLQIGQGLRLPLTGDSIQALGASTIAPAEASPAALDEAPNPPAVYTVLSGDTLLGIALKLGLEAEAIARANGLESLDRIAVGDELKLPLVTLQPEAVPVVGEAALEPAALPTMETAVTPRSSPVSYEVALGDTVSGLAERFGVDTETIVTTNQLRSADRITVGDQLTILPVSGVMHTVRPGDTLSGIAARYKVDLGPIIDFNYLDNADVIPIDKELIIPGAKPIEGPSAPRSIEYQVARGDTLSSIAARFGADATAIARVNGLANPDRLSLGATLTIPAPGSQVVTRNLPVPQPGPQRAGARPSNAPPSSLGDAIASNAMRYVGSRYAWGGTSPAGFDCSGLVYYVFAQSGRPISRGLWGQYNAGPHLGRNELQPGDIVFFQNTYMPGLSHNGIYLGGGRFIHAVDERSGVRVSSLSEGYWTSRWFGATRVL